MKKEIIKTSVLLLILLLSNCGERKLNTVEIKDVCSQPSETNVLIQGYLSLPQMLEFTKFRRGEQSGITTYKLFLTSQQDASGNQVTVILSATRTSEPNKIKFLPERYTEEDLIAYTNNGKTIVAGNLVKLTGKVTPNEKNGCQVNVVKIENP